MSGQLVPSAGASFQQTGTVDWVALSNSTVGFSVGALARLSRARVDAYTVEVGKALCLNVQLIAKTQEKVVEEIKSLKRVRYCDNLLWIGFGIKDILTDLAETEQGLALVALCSALTTNYDTFYAAQVLRQLSLQANLPQAFTPALYQWKALLRFCSGVLMSSPFHKRLIGLHRHVRGTEPIISKNALEPASIAKALSNLARLSKGSFVRLSFSGSTDICWLAAFAEWILSLDVTIYDATGSLIYRSPDQEFEAPQVVFNLDTDATRTDLPTRKTTLIPPGQTLIMLEASDHGARNVNLHSTWATILHDAFGSAIDTLLGGRWAQDFGTFLLGTDASRYDRRHANHRDALALLPLPQDSHLSDSLMTLAKRMLPKLDRLSLQDLERRKNHRKYATSLTNIETYCCGDHTRFGNATRCRADPCLVHLASTIRAYLRILLATDIGDQVLPSTRGLRLLHEDGNREVKEPIKLVYEVLTGHVSPGGSSAIHAIVSNGVCIFRRLLEDPMRPVSRVQSFAAVRGYISYEDGWYESLSDMGIIPSFKKSGQAEQLNVVARSQAIATQSVVEETEDERSLLLGYKIWCSQLHRSNRSHWLKLGDLMSGLQNAKHRLCLEHRERQPGYYHQSRVSTDEHIPDSVEEGLVRWAREDGFVLSHFVPSPSNDSPSMLLTLFLYFGEGPALYVTYDHYTKTHPEILESKNQLGEAAYEQIELTKCQDCLDCLLASILPWGSDWEIRVCSEDPKAQSNITFRPRMHGVAHLYGLQDMPITLDLEAEQIMFPKVQSWIIYKAIDIQTAQSDVADRIA